MRASKTKILRQEDRHGMKNLKARRHFNRQVELCGGAKNHRIIKDDTNAAPSLMKYRWAERAFFVRETKCKKCKKRPRRMTTFKVLAARVRPRRPKGPKRVGGGGPPRGVTIRRPPKVCQQRARLMTNWLCPITAGQSRHSFAHFGLKCSKPLSFPFNNGLGITANPTPKSGKVWFFRIFGRFFRLPNRA